MCLGKGTGLASQLTHDPLYRIYCLLHSNPIVLPSMCSWRCNRVITRLVQLILYGNFLLINNLPHLKFPGYLISLIPTNESDYI
jgi:hypothetical protein